MSNATTSRIYNQLCPPLPEESDELAHLTWITVAAISSHLPELEKLLGLQQPDSQFRHELSQAILICVLTHKFPPKRHSQNRKELKEISKDAALAERSGFTLFRMPMRERQAARSVFRVMSPRPASRPAMEISSSMSSQWRPVRLSSTLSRWAAVACNKRGNHANGTPKVRPSLSSTHIVCSSNRTAVAEMLMPSPQDQIPVFYDNA